MPKLTDVADWPAPIPGLINAHEVTHLLDMVGTACHVIFMVRFIVPYERESLASGGSRSRLTTVPALAEVA